VDDRRWEPVWVGEGPSGDILVAGVSRLDDGSAGEGILVALTAEGSAAWARTVGPGGLLPRAVARMDDGWLVAAGRPEAAAPGAASDVMALALGTGGDLRWQVRLEAPGDDGPRVAAPLSEGRFLVLGSTDSFGSRAEGDLDVWLVVLDGDGAVLAQRTVGGLDPDTPLLAWEDADGALVVVGHQGEDVASWHLDSDLELVDGCGITRDTDARVVADPLRTAGAALDARDAGELAFTMVATTVSRPPPLREPVCSQ